MVALLLIQFFQTLQLYDRKSTQFKAKVLTSLERIAIRHEKSDAIRRYMQVVNKDFSGQYKDILKQEFQNLLAVQESIAIKDTTILEEGELQNYLIIQGKSFDSLTGTTAEHRVMARDVRQLRQLFNRESGNFPKKDSMSLAIELDQRVMQQIFRKSKYVNNLIQEAFGENAYDVPASRIDVEFLDSVIAHEMKNDELPSDYQFEIVDENGEPVRFEHPTTKYRTDLDTNKLARTSLFPSDILGEKLELYLYFPGRSSFLFREMGVLFFVSLGLVVLIIIAISFMFRTILTQKKLGEMKNDFISNMTHEFKTPISTISLACEAMSDVDMMGGNISHSAPFVKMINDENKRLSVLVERILQSAVIDRGELKMKKETLNLTELVQQVCDHARFRIGSGGELKESFPKEQLFIIGDRVHTTNVVSNLIDNAVKYSKERPKIEVTLKKEGTRITLSIADEGIGITKEHISKIFDKLYRVPTGNIHNVKGFGLGLSYVKAIVELNNWNMQVKSKPGEGTVFTLIIAD